MARVHQSTLENGLKVILKKTTAAPVVSTWLWYRVGSRNEVGSYTGLSHWVEHMMFKGSRQYPKGTIMRLIDRHGGYANAMTSHDFTTYYATLPSDHAILPLQIEADRMTGASFDPEEVASERTVILSEREGNENEPGYLLAEEVTAAAFRVHPYHHQSIGWRQDLQAIDQDTLLRFYKRHYMPNNAVLVIVGDIDPEAHHEHVKTIFGHIPTGDLPAQRIPQEPPQRGERRVKLRMPGSAPILRISYHVPPVSHKDYIPLVVADAVLSGGKAMFAFGGSSTRSTRLYRALVEKELASSVGSSYHPSLDPYLFNLGATVRDGRQPQEVEEALVEQIHKLQREPVPSKELRTAIKQTQAQFAYSSESVTSQALTLGFLEMVDHHERMGTILDELARVTPDDVLRVTQAYLTEDERIVGLFEPTREIEPTQKTSWQMPRETISYYRPHGSTIAPESVTRHVLPNGAIVLIKERPSSAAVTMSGRLSAGSLLEESTETGLAALTAAMLRRGTSRHSYQELNRQLDAVGATATFSGGRDEVSFAGRCLAADFDLLASITGEVLTTPTFPEQEFAKIRGQLVTHLGELEMDTSYRANRAFRSALYSEEHPYGRSLIGTREHLSTVTPTDLHAFYERCYHPSSLLISVVGAVDAGHVLDTLASTLGNWSPPSPAIEWSFPDVAPTRTISCQKEYVPGRPQIDLIMGNVGMSRISADYYAALMANIILGHQGLLGRLGNIVRNTKGLAYHVTSSLRSGRGKRPWTVTAGLDAKHVENAVDAIVAELDRLATEPVTDQEIDDCQSYLKGMLPLQLETNEGISDFLLATEVYGLGLNFLQRYPAIIDSVSKTDIQRVVGFYLPSDAYVLALAGDL